MHHAPAARTAWHSTAKAAWSGHGPSASQEGAHSHRQPDGVIRPPGAAPALAELCSLRGASPTSGTAARGSRRLQRSAGSRLPAYL